jgi:PAS domain S-box-containing protein
VSRPLDRISAVSLLDGFPEPTLVMDAEGIIEYGNPAAAALFGKSGFAAGESINAYMPEDERTRLQPLVWLKRWADAPSAPELRHVHLNCRTAAGLQIPVQVRVGRLVDDPHRYVVMLQDIREVQARVQQTREAHRLAARMLAISADAIIAVDESLTIVYANPAADQLFELASGQLLNQPLANLLPERFRAGHQQFMKAFAADTRPSRLMGERTTITGLTASGLEIPLEASIAKITTAGGLIMSAHLRVPRSRPDTSGSAG